ncbi:MAG: TraR/DksA C4-type zinc finger protein [Candidatus Pacebacteria bacterium]|nr:TraR/DksA C4-type zinc finger protein [Candidatus Paceibacterota bacterium]
MRDTAQYKARLETMLSELTKELETIGIHNPTNPSDWIATPEGTDHKEADPNVAADKVEEWDERRGTVAVLETRYNNIVRALKKIDEGAFGICEVSGEPIEEDRLEANPAARTNKAHMNDEVDLPQ